MELTFANKTTIRTGGQILSFTEIDNADELTDLSLDNQMYMVLGQGSNLLVSDMAITKPVLCFNDKKLEILDDRIIVGAGMVWDDFVGITIEMGFSGLETLSGIPGTVGGAAVQNIGAYGQEISSFITKVRIWDQLLNIHDWWDVSKMDYVYRNSRIKGNERFIVSSIEFKLNKNIYGVDVVYADLIEFLTKNVSNSLNKFKCQEIRQAVKTIRASKGMLINEQTASDHDTWSCGSFFTNPILLPNFAETFYESNPKAPLYNSSQGIKTSAAWLIENAGFPKGYPHKGNATLSTKHTLAITNRGGAKTSDIINLAREVKLGVFNVYGIELIHEPVLLDCEV